jgi:hypothetical protein
VSQQGPEEPGRDPAPEAPTVVARPATPWAPSPLPGWGEPRPAPARQDGEPETTVFPRPEPPPAHGRGPEPSPADRRSETTPAGGFGRADPPRYERTSPPPAAAPPSTYRGSAPTTAAMAAAAGVRRPVAGPSRPAASRPMPRRARLTLKKIDPWSVLKVTFIYSLALYVVILVAIAVLYGVLAGMGVFHSLNSFLSTVGASGKVSAYLGFGRIFLYALVVGAVNVVLFTALATLGAFIYNLCGDLVGGLELTLTETE